MDIVVPIKTKQPDTGVPNLFPSTFHKMRSIGVCLLLLLTQVFAKPIQIEDGEEYSILDRFFKWMITYSEYGYVLEGNKPISQINIFPIDNLIAPQSRNFQTDTFAREAIRVWKKIKPTQKDFVLKATEIPSKPFNYPTYELLFINVPKLKEEVEKNLFLFRYVLGPSIETDQLLTYILFSEEPLSEILREDNVLIGIVLGFGTYNSLMHSRAELIQNALLKEDQPPFTPHSNWMRQNSLVDLEEMQIRALFLAQKEREVGSDSETCIVHPGVGFSDLNEELEAIVSRKIETPLSLSQEVPRFIFGAYQHPSNSRLIKDLTVTQKKVQDLLKRSDCLEYIVGKISGNQPSISNILPASSLELNGNLELLLAKMVWSTTSQLDGETVPEFIQAFCQADISNAKQGKNHVFPGSLAGLRKAQKHLQFSNELFANMSEKSSLQELIPKYLYTEQTCEGKGEKVHSSENVLLSYCIEDGYGNTLTAKQNHWIELSTTIPGFAIGVRQMREGESRTLYIHPALAYGALTTLPPCISLVSKITVHQVNVKPQQTSLEYTPLDLDWVLDETFTKKMGENNIQLAKSLGTRWGIWLRESPDIDFSKVCKYLTHFLDSRQHLPLPNLQHEAALCNKAFWNLLHYTI
ncbi:MAG: hypothetical protein K940chlam9_01108 [Chlamydiae bacterium]|nr:hypothetical protein [Chlamydiota bacterium]